MLVLELFDDRSHAGGVSATFTGHAVKDFGHKVLV
jgi:hypothetical protein